MQLNREGHSVMVHNSARSHTGEEKHATCECLVIAARCRGVARPAPVAASTLAPRVIRTLQASRCPLRAA